MLVDCSDARVVLCCLVLGVLRLMCPCKSRGVSSTRRLECKEKKQSETSGLVNTSANWSLLLQNLTWRDLAATQSCTKRKSISMCLVRELYTGLDVKYVTLKLSHHNTGGVKRGKPSYLIKICNQITSVVMLAKNLHSISMLDLVIVLYFFEL